MVPRKSPVTKITEKNLFDEFLAIENSHRYVIDFEHALIIYQIIFLIFDYLRNLDFSFYENNVHGLAHLLNPNFGSYTILMIFYALLRIINNIENLGHFESV